MLKSRITNGSINKLIGVTEAYKTPERLLEIVLDESKKAVLFDKFLEIESDLSYEWFHEYFESEHADRKVKKQDFTPDAVSKLGVMLLGKSDKYFEAAAGTGGMAIQFWKKNPNAYFELEELSDRAIPFLLFNMSIRGMRGIVIHGDSLTKKNKGKYILNPKGKFSEIN